jgi:DNA-binding beta-propeller fold protein YncE
LGAIAAAAAAAFLAAPVLATTLVPPPVAHTMGFRRVTERQVAIAIPGAKLVDPAGIAVVRLRATDGPERTDDDEVTVVAVDRGSGRLFTNFGPLRAGSWSGEGGPTGPLATPSDVAIDADGRVAVTDTGNRRVVLLRHDGASLRAERVFDGFLEPRGIAADGRGGFYVCDRRFNAVFHLDAVTGKRTTFGLETAFDRPVAVATVPEGDRLARGKEPRVVVADLDGARLRSFSLSGSLHATLEASSVGVPDARFDAVEIDYYGNVYAADAAGHRMHKLRDDLFPLDTFGAEGTGQGQFRSPRGIAIHRRLGQVFVTEADGAQYLWVGTDVRELRVEPRAGAMGLAFVLTEESTLTVRVRDAHGAEVATLAADRRTPCGPFHGEWDGTDARGERVPGGSYTLEIRARATYASRSVFERTVERAFAFDAGTGAR